MKVDSHILTEEQKNLAAENYGLIFSFIERHPKYCSHYLDYEDLISEMHLRLCYAAAGFDESRGFQFSTYAFGGFQLGISALLRGQQKNEPVDCFSNNEGIGNLVDNDTKVDVSSLQRALEHSDLSPRTLGIFKGYFLEGQTLESIGRFYNLSRERVRQIIEGGISQLKRKWGEKDYRVEDFWINRDSPYGQTLWLSQVDG